MSLNGSDEAGNHQKGKTTTNLSRLTPEDDKNWICEANDRLISQWRGGKKVSYANLFYSFDHVSDFLMKEQDKHETPYSKNVLNLYF